MPKTPSEFIFRKVVSFGSVDYVPHGLVNVYERDGDLHVGQLHPALGGGYVLRNRNGEPLGDFDHGRTPSWSALSRPHAAGMLRTYVRKQDERLAARTGTVTEGCPNAWHNTADYRGKTACPECPTQPGLAYAVKLLEKGGVQGPLFAAILREQIYTPATDEDGDKS